MPTCMYKCKYMNERLYVSKEYIGMLYSVPRPNHLYLLILQVNSVQFTIVSLLRTTKLQKQKQTTGSCQAMVGANHKDRNACT